MSLAAGDRLGPYEIVALLGEGGMGSVFKARDPRLGRLVAIKTSKQEFNERFEREARAVAALNHPNVCQVYDVGALPEGTGFLVMEHIEGEPLLSRDRPGPLPLSQTLAYAGQIADALSEAHSKNITHRDLKPANILVTKDGRVKVLDFGLAKVSDAKGADAGAPANEMLTQSLDNTQPGTILGTAAYMSPEQAEGKDVDTRSDLFAFGAILYEMASGQKAFQGDSWVSIVSSVLRGEPRPISSAPLELQHLISRCLRKRREDRFQSAAEIRLALNTITAGQSGSALSGRFTKPPEQIPSIAVLPFSNLSADRENEYFSDGLAEEIITLLAKIPGLKVIARTSSFAFRGKEADLRTIGERLKVRTILEGSVRRAGNRIRVTAQLVQVDDETQIWSERFDRDLTDIFEIQDEIGQAIASALRLKLTAHARVTNIDAYQQYLKGIHLVQQLTPDALARAKDLFEAALAIDPEYAPAYGGLALLDLADCTLSRRPMRESAAAMRSAAEKALMFDPNESTAHSVLGAVAAVMEHDWLKAENHFLAALSSPGSLPMIRYRYCLFILIPQGRVEESIAQARLALESDPLYMPSYFVLMWSITMAKRYDEALAVADVALKLSPYWLILLVRGFVFLALNRNEEALASTNQALAQVPWYWPGHSYLWGAYWKTGEKEKAARLVEEAKDRSHQEYVSPAAFVAYYAITGDRDLMYQYWDEAIAIGEAFATRVPYDPHFAEYVSEPRFQAMLKKMNLA